MIGTRGTMKHYRTHIHNVPLLFCPVCHHVEVHYLVQHEYEILAEYAHSDGAYEVDFEEYLDSEDLERLAENCVNHENEDPLEIVKNQIDMALDLMMFAKQLNDEEWIEQLKKRLVVLGERKEKLYKKNTNRTGGLK